MNMGGPNLNRSPREKPKKATEGFASEYMAKIHEQSEIIKDVENLLGAIRYSSSLKPEAVSKVIKIQEKRMADARAEIKRLQDENEGKITKHFKKAA